ncbi:aldo/keto reductase [Companilactobacillus alimentarius]|uniref:2,5-diketo-D-gluconic acid reductase n=1 Tax=Companilactobacillus alimentarius DSM 20249 TaxID=1423720 RepID=A0A2K9HID3_9LACO|nr:aldo/keto reductase [Companilactobacillus alimentarius]AUI72311.1 2,5-diketo-D-gluconic acid reductase [Companilactobacillus alimentarius DSM 20249]KRK75747.1 organophosphate reductase [Companilactobacillus alimentarius DSM 20249]MDT6952891.1 aldo/keto reductase [Companilactobacillus alimentarius]GEO45669.1 2,5-diketo-D-gluconic acid reductase [Companilactobacillus alimentarius]
MEFKTLNNGVKIPMLGLGVFRINDPTECEEAVYQAIKAGYRFIDTATAYQNEAAVGRGIKRSGIDRKELFISTKLWITDTNYEGAKRGLNNSLRRLGLDYIDLYTIHQPYNDYYGAWRAMEELYEAGKIRALGVDNFRQDRLADFIEFNKIKPQVNLLETHPFYQRQAETDFLKSENILQIAWSPFAAGQFGIFTDQTLIKIAKNHGKSVGQVVLRWLMQRGIAAIPKTSHISRMKENLDIFDFELNNDEMNSIGELEQGKTVAGNRETAKEVREFFDAFSQLNTDE